jgi:DNA-binding GntR family transcriptional regulator
MSTPIKRLEIIKNAIELEDDDIIQSQLTRLKNEAFDDELQAIVVALEQKNYTAAIRAITAWLQGQRAITRGATRKWQPASWS